MPFSFVQAYTRGSAPCWSSIPPRSLRNSLPLEWQHEWFMGALLLHSSLFQPGHHSPWSTQHAVWGQCSIWHQGTYFLHCELARKCASVWLCCLSLYWTCYALNVDDVWKTILWVQICVLKRFQNVCGACNELYTHDCTRGVIRDWIVHPGRVIGCGYDTERYPKEETYRATVKKRNTAPKQGSRTLINGIKSAWKQLGEAQNRDSNYLCVVSIWSMSHVNLQLLLCLCCDILASAIPLLVGYF